MTLFIPKSRFRHIYGIQAKESSCYRNLKISKNTHDSNLSDVNQKFLAIAQESIGGGSFIVLRLGNTGRIPTDFPSVTGHRAAVTDIKWNPFNPQQIASSSEDGVVRLWNIPNSGLVQNLTKPIGELKSHTSRVSYIRWHTLAENIIASAGADKQVIIWDVSYSRPVAMFGKFPDICYSLSWGFYGQLLSCTNKDKKLRIFDVRAQKAIVETVGHAGVRSSKISFLRDDQRLVTCGYSPHGNRQAALWDIRSIKTPLSIETIDHGSGVMNLHYDPDLQLIYLIGKGDGNFRYYEILKSASSFYYLSEYTSPQPQRAFCAMPKIGLDFNKNEIARIYKLYATGSIVEPISVIVPRKSEQFQADIYPNTLDCLPAMTSEEWLAGENRPPQFVSIKELQRVMVSKGCALLDTARDGDDSENSKKQTKFQSNLSSNMEDDLSAINRPPPPPPPTTTDGIVVKDQTSLNQAQTNHSTMRTSFATTIHRMPSIYSDDDELFDSSTTCMNSSYTVNDDGSIAARGSLDIQRKAMSTTSFDMLNSPPLTKRNSVLENVRKLEETIRRFNDGVYNNSTLKSTLQSDQRSTSATVDLSNVTTSRKVKEISQAFERPNDYVMGSSRDRRNESPSCEGHRRTRSLRATSYVNSNKKEVRFRERNLQSQGGQVSGAGATSTSAMVNLTAEEKCRHRDSAHRSRSPDTHEADMDAANISKLSNGVNRRENDSSKMRESQAITGSTRNSWRSSKTEGSFSQPPTVPQRQEKAYENWKSVKDLNRRLLIHEERIRQLEAKVNEFVST